VAGFRGDPDTELPVVIGGDFNAPPDSDEIRLLTGRRAVPVKNLVLSDCWEQVGDGPGATWRHDNPYQAATAWPNRRLDYVFVSWPRPKPLGNPLAAWLTGLGPVDGVHPSDHAAVVVELFDGD
jgi:endonuclease/exonuclease/phosphatase family metal-dependent hydrolase